MALDKDSELKFPEVLLIDASAGSGKTRTLTKRLIQFLLSDRLKDKHSDLSNILAITFTNNAAREMKQRLIELLKKLALNLKSDQEMKDIYALFSLKPEAVRKRAKDFIPTLINRYADLHVQTIDSFMNRILRSSADELGMPPENEVTDSYSEISNEALNMLFAQVGTEISLAEIDAFLEFFNQIQLGFKWNPVRDISAQFNNFLQEEGRILENILFEDRTKNTEEAYHEIYELYEQIKQYGLEDKIRKPIKDALGNGEFSRFDIKKFFDTFSSEDYGLLIRGVSIFLAEPENEERGKRLIQCVADLADQFSLSRYSSYGMLYDHFKTCLATVKRRMRTIHFDDINKRLSNYIQQEIVPEIYYRLGDVFYHFLLDEFQDTAPVQWNNIFPLLDEAYARGGTLFVVGDLKQAIYMFRKADYRIMRNLKLCIEKKINKDCLPSSVKGSARIIPLEQNFRSGGVILDYVDSIFKQKLKDLMPELLTEDKTYLTTYTQNPLQKKKGHGYVRTMIIHEDGDEVPEREILIDIINDAKQRYPLGEIAVLTHENKQVEDIVSWLTEESIPAASLSSLDIRKRKIIMELCNLLNFLNTPVDDLSFASFITGDLFLAAVRQTVSNVERQEIFDLIAKKRQEREDYLYTYFRDHSQYRELWQKYFDNLFKIVGYYPLYDLVSEIYKIFDVFSNFPKETAFLVQFLEAISALESQGKGSIKNFMEIVTEEKEIANFKIVLPEYVDAVKAMTIHKAKGLGFDVVINLFKTGEKTPGLMLFDRKDGGLYARYVTKYLYTLNTHLKDIYDEECLDLRIESLNLMYVALTRARHELHNLVVRKESNSQKASKLEVRDLFEDYESGSREEGIPEKEAPAYTTASMPAAPQYPAKREEDMKWSAERLMESKKGDLFHKVLESIEYLDDTSTDAMLTDITRAIEKDRLAYDPAEIHEMLMQFLRIPEVRTWFEKKKDRQVLREREFVNEEGRVYRMDRVVIDQNRIILIDFKTGSPLDFYAKQMENYKRMIQKLYPGRPINCFHAYVDSGRIEPS